MPERSPVCDDCEGTGVEVMPLRLCAHLEHASEAEKQAAGRRLADALARHGEVDRRLMAPKHQRVVALREAERALDDVSDDVQLRAVATKLRRLGFRRLAGRLRAVAKAEDRANRAHNAASAEIERAIANAGVTS